MTVREQVRERSGGRCELCRSKEGVQHHHIIHGRGRRKECETVESVIALCWEHHHGTYGVHGSHGHVLDLKLKKALQKKYVDQGKTEAEIRQLMGGTIY